jgi:AcrR family transcriptional regulator
MNEVSPTGRKRGRRPSRDRNQRSDVTEAALTLFAERGYRSTGIRDIADALGIGTTSVYSHIRSKAELLREIVSGTMEDLLAAQDDATHSSDDPATQVRRFAESQVLYFTRFPRQALIATGEFVWLEGDDLRRTTELRNRYRHNLEEILRSGDSSGVFRVESPKIAAFAIIEMCEGVPRWFRPGGELSESRVAYLYGEYAVSIARDGRPGADRDPQGD